MLNTNKNTNLTPNYSTPVPAIYRKGVLRYVERFLTRHGKPIFYFRKTRKDPRIRLPDTYGSVEFMAAYRKAFSGEITPIPKPEPSPIIKNAPARVTRALKDCLKRARQRSTELKLPFDLDLEWLVAKSNEQAHSCALTGIQFFSDWHSPHSRLNPTIPSIDRIIPLEGYTKANCRVVCIAVNIMILDWGEEVFAAMSEAYRAHKARAAITQETGE